MATKYATLGLLRAEVEARIASLVPTAWPGKRFVKRPLRDRDERDILETTGKTRLFEVGMAGDEGDANLVGHTVRSEVHRLPISITYQDTPDWRRAAWDDADRIGHDLMNSISEAPAGVEIRHLDSEIKPQQLESDDDDWFVLALTLYALIRVS